MPNDVFERTLKLASGSFFCLPGSCWVTYFPESGTARRIEAVIERPGPEGNREVVELLVKNDSSSGISTSEIDTGGDKVEVSQRTNKRPVQLRIVEVLHHDAAMLKIKLV